MPFPLGSSIAIAMLFFLQREENKSYLFNGKEKGAEEEEEEED